LGVNAHGPRLLGIQRALRDRPHEFGPLPEILAIHIGLNSGPVVVGKIGDNRRMDYFCST